MRSAVLGLSLLLVLSAPAVGDDSQHAPEHKVTQSESYIMIEPMYATIMDNDRPAGMLLVAIGLDIPDPKLRATVMHALPVLRDAYLRNLMSFAWTHVRLNEQPDVLDIADRMQRVTDRTLHQTGARVLLAQISESVRN